jgi:hypothetical protein
VTEQQDTLTPKQAARYVGISEAALTLWRSENKGPRHFKDWLRLIVCRNPFLEVTPLSLLLLIVLVLSLGIALHMAGPISIQTHPVEVPGIDIHIGTTSTSSGANQHKHVLARTRPKRSLPRSRVP